MNDKSRTRRLVWKELLIVLPIVLIVAAGVVCSLPLPRQPSHVWRATISMAQLRKISAAVTEYAEAHGQRPAHLETLVEVGALAPRDLFDAQREEIPSIDPATGRFEGNPDVVYFPAVRKDDPADLVLLCTLLTHERDDKLLVAYNNGKLGELTPHEMIIAMNRTYGFIGGEIAYAQPPTTPAGQQVN